MKKLFIIICGLLLVGCTQTDGPQNANGTVNKNTEDPSAFEATVKPVAEAPQTETVKNESTPTKVLRKSATTKQKYTGEILAGNLSPVLDFNKADYDKAFASDKIIVLYFYANWCPICAEEIPNFYEALEEIDNEKVIGFRVNFKDDDTDSYEENLAREFGVAYQHTKVIIKDQKRRNKAPNSWAKKQYITIINNLLNR